jgi:hypothetical protein
VVKLLSSDYVKPKIISTLSDGLRKAGLHLTLSDIVVREDTGKDKIPHMTDPEKDEGLLPDAIEDKIIDALAGWLKQTLTVYVLGEKPEGMIENEESEKTYTAAFKRPSR